MSTTSGREVAGEGHGLLAVSGLADDLEVGLDLEDHPEPAAHQGLVVDDQHADHAPSRPRPWSAGARGRVATSSKPPSDAVGRPGRRRRPRRAPAARAGRARPRRRVGDASSVVADRELELFVAVVDRDLGAGRRDGVPQGVGQAFLDQAVRRQVEPGRAGAAARPVTATSTGRPASRNCSTSRASWVRPGAGSRSAGLAALAQHADHATHLGQGLATDGLDGLEGLALGGLVVGEPAAYGGGLHGHDADAVADHVVQLTRDAVAFLGDRSGGQVLASQPSLFGVQDAAAHERTDEPRDHPGRPPHRLAGPRSDRRLHRVEGDPGEAEDQEEDEAPPRGSPLFPSGHAVRRHHRRHGHAEALRRPDGHELQDVDRDHPGEDRQRGDPAAQQQQGAQPVGERLHPLRALTVGGAGTDPHLELSDDQDDAGDEEVEQEVPPGHRSTLPPRQTT